MHALYKLKDMLCEELESYAEMGRMNANTLAIVDTLAHALKNLDRVIMTKEEEMEGGSFAYDGGSNRSYEGSFEGSNRGSYQSYDDGYSSRRGRDSMGRFTSRRGYSRADEMVDQLKKLAE